MDCCELAVYNGKLALYIALGAFVTIILCFAMVRDYYVKMKGLTIELKKKNGHEQHQIDQLKERMGKKDQEITELKAKLTSHD